MGKIKNDFQHWLGQNHSNVIRSGNIACPIPTMAALVEEYIIHTSNKLKNLDSNQGLIVLPKQNDDVISIIDQTAKEFNLTNDELDELKRMLSKL